MGKDLLFVDIETTGLKVEDGAVPLAIGFLYEKEGQPVEHLIVTIKPTPEEWAKASPDALKVNGFTWEQLEADGVDPETARLQIARWLYDHGITRGTVTYIGQNPKFDVCFLKHFMLAELEWLDFPLDNPVDVIELAKLLERKDRSIKFQRYAGWAIARALMVEEEGALHTALGGIEAVRRNYHAVVARLNNLN